MTATHTMTQPFPPVPGCCSGYIDLYFLLHLVCWAVAVILPIVVMKGALEPHSPWTTALTAVTVGFFIVAVGGWRNYDKGVMRDGAYEMLALSRYGTRKCIYLFGTYYSEILRTAYNVFGWDGGGWPMADLLEDAVGTLHEAALDGAAPTAAPVGQAAAATAPVSIGVSVSGDAADQRASATALALPPLLPPGHQAARGIFQAAPSQAAPSQAAPSQAAPSQAAPSQAAPSQAAPSQAAPSLMLFGNALYSFSAGQAASSSAPNPELQQREGPSSSPLGQQGVPQQREGPASPVRSLYPGHSAVPSLTPQREDQEAAQTPGWAVQRQHGSERSTHSEALPSSCQATQLGTIRLTSFSGDGCSRPQ